MLLLHNRPLLLTALLIWGSDPLVARGCNSADCTCQEVIHTRQRGCWLASTGNFRVCSFTSAGEAEQVARHCEKLRFELAKLYGFESHKAKWQPLCEVYLFPNKQRYGAVVGRAAIETLGSSLVKPATGMITSRRIDLRSDVANYLMEVLPHELTHVLIADHFRDGPPPLWYDEGLALLADSPSKQSLHLRDLRNGMNRGTVFSLTELLIADRYPQADRVSVFYGQCASLAQCLCNHSEAARVHQFARRSQKVGVSLALEETYGIHGVPELERLWRNSLHSRVPVSLAHHSRSENSTD